MTQHENEKREREDLAGDVADEVGPLAPRDARALLPVVLRLRERGGERKGEVCVRVRVSERARAFAHTRLSACG